MTKTIFNVLIISLMPLFSSAQNKAGCFRDCQFYYVTVVAQAGGPADRQSFSDFLHAKKQELGFYSLISQYRRDKLSEEIADSVLMTQPVRAGGQADSDALQFIDKLPKNIINLGRLKPKTAAEIFLLNTGDFMEITRADCLYNDMILVVRGNKIVGFAGYCFQNKFGEIKLPCTNETAAFREYTFYRLTEIMHETIGDYIQKFRGKK